MELTKKQQEGLDIAVKRYHNREKYTVISGYAGTGKSTLVKFIISALNVNPDRVCYSAFTGKAVEVLKKKGNPNVFTLDKLLYAHFPKPNGGFFRKRKPILDYDVVVVDEVSMAPKSLIDILFSHHCYVICLGDPFQLPTINKNEDNHLLEHPHVFLDEIMRQAEDSEIIQLSLKIRNGESLDFFNGNNVKILPISALSDSMLLWADQILVGTNATRISYNNYIRKLLGRGDAPEDGDKVICLRNYWDEINANGDALVNGTIGYLRNSFKTFVSTPPYLKIPDNKLDVLQADFEVDNEVFTNVDMDNKMILTGEKCCDWQTEYKLNRRKNKDSKSIVPKEFTYGYAITCHKAQGSEWDKVLILEEAFPFDPVEHTRWLYTAITRASDKVVIIRR